MGVTYNPRSSKTEIYGSVLNTEGAKFMGVDIKSFFITVPLDRYEYMKMPLDLFPEHTVQQYDLKNKAKNIMVLCI